VIRYLGGPTVEIKPGMTLLEASRAADVPHASVCGGRGRCSTCRVRVEEGLESLAPPAGAEAITLTSIEAPPDVRLACQVRPCASLTVAIPTPPATPGPTEVEFVELKEVVAAHARARLAGQLVEFASSDAQAVANWFRGRIAYPIAVPSLASEAYPLLGGRVDYVLGRPTAALVYVRHERAITLLVVPEALSGMAAVRGQRNGTHVVAWADAGFTYFAVSDLPPGELERLEACRPTPAAMV
jgi:ferredoxin